MIYLEYKFRDINIEKIRGIGLLTLGDRRLPKLFHAEISAFFPCAQVYCEDWNGGQSLYDVVFILLENDANRTLRETWRAIRYAKMISNKYIALYEVRKRIITVFEKKKWWRWYLTLVIERTVTKAGQMLNHMLA